MITKNIKNSNIYYISLESDQHRRDNLIKNLQKLGLAENAIHIRGILGKSLVNECYLKEISEMLNINLVKTTPKAGNTPMDFHYRVCGKCFAEFYVMVYILILI